MDSMESCLCKISSEVTEAGKLNDMKARGAESPVTTPPKLPKGQKKHQRQARNYQALAQKMLVASQDPAIIEIGRTTLPSISPSNSDQEAGRIRASYVHIDASRPSKAQEVDAATIQASSSIMSALRLSLSSTEAGSRVPSRPLGNCAETNVRRETENTAPMLPVAVSGKNFDVNAHSSVPKLPDMLTLSKSQRKRYRQRQRRGPKVLDGQAATQKVPEDEDSSATMSPRVIRRDSNIEIEEDISLHGDGLLPRAKLDDDESTSVTSLAATSEAPQFISEESNALPLTHSTKLSKSQKKRQRQAKKRNAVKLSRLEELPFHDLGTGSTDAEQGPHSHRPREESEHQNGLSTTHEAITRNNNTEIGGVINKAQEVTDTDRGKHRTAYPRHFCSHHHNKEGVVSKSALPHNLIAKASYFARATSISSSFYFRPPHFIPYAIPAFRLPPTTWETQQLYPPNLHGAQHRFTATRLSLLSLPIEIQLQILEVCLVAHCPFIELTPPNNRSRYYGESYAYGGVTMNVLRTCRLYWKEGCKIFFNQNKFVFYSPENHPTSIGSLRPYHSILSKFRHIALRYDVQDYGPAARVLNEASYIAQRMQAVATLDVEILGNWHGLASFKLDLLHNKKNSIIREIHRPIMTRSSGEPVERVRLIGADMENRRNTLTVRGLKVETLVGAFIKYLLPMLVGIEEWDEDRDFEVEQTYDI